jgi:teichuronic acid biosynthesis glycosyltransferase TuaG
MSDPTFTVVMPAFNTAAMITAAIETVIKQTRDDWELIVVDDGSTDDTASRVRPFQSDARIQLVQQENRGLAGARNTAIRHARGRYLSMFDSDDLWMPNHLEVMATVLDNDPGLAFGHSDAWVLDETTRRIRRTTAMFYQHFPDPQPTDSTEFLSLLLERNFVSANATVRSAVFEDVGLFNPALRSAEDYELWLRIVAHGYRGVQVPDIVVIRRERAGSLTSNELAMARWRREVYRIVAEEYDLPEVLRDKARAAMRARDRQIAALTGEDRIGAIKLRFRRRLGSVKHRLMWRRLWFESPPPEVSSVFPDLRAV